VRVRRFVHTVRYLRPVQILYRLRRLVPARIPQDGDIPQVSPLVRPLVAGPRRSPSMLGENRFRFLNEERELDLPAAWHDTSVSALWLYNLHYFDDLISLDAESREESHAFLIERWIRENPPGRGVGWAPYPTSLRIVNWIKWDIRVDRQDVRSRANLAVQVRWLERNLEHHLQANHLLANYKALLIAGLYFAGAEAGRWRQLGITGLTKQLAEQVLGDGGHYERSPMYHSIILEDLLDCIAISHAVGFEPPEAWKKTASRMIGWLRLMVHPGGEITFFNDAALGIAPTLADLVDYAARLGIEDDGRGEEELLLSESGFARASFGPAMLFCDVGTPGPSHQPGHAHAGTLSFELSLFGKRLFVNSGISEYGTSEERARQRGTRAHNTVVVDGSDSSEVWAGFRVARRARVQDVRAESVKDTTVIRASHDGYRRLEGAPVHERQWRLAPSSLEVVDRLNGRGTHDVEVGMLLHPEVKLQTVAAGHIVLEHAASPVEVSAHGLFRLSVEEATFHPEFGLAIPTHRLVARARVELPVESMITIIWGTE
jgi:uncharacterized heparinase superfamily protein